MKSIKNKFFFFLAVLTITGFSSCEDSDNDFATELIIQNKVELLESS